MAADCLETEFDNVVAFGVDTDVSPYDSGSYASATTYATGNAVINACSELKKRIIKVGAGLLGVAAEEAEFDGKRVYAGDKEVSLQDVAYKGTCGNTGASGNHRLFFQDFSSAVYDRCSRGGSGQRDRKY